MVFTFIIKTVFKKPRLNTVDGIWSIVLLILGQDSVIIFNLKSNINHYILSRVQQYNQYNIIEKKKF